MSNLLQTGSDWLEGMRNTYASQSVTYARGVNSVTLNASFGKTIYEEDDEYIRVKGEVMDFLLFAAELIIDGSVVLPQVADRISIVRGGSSVVYEVMPLLGQGHYRFSDSFGKTLRIHTKQVG